MKQITPELPGNINVDTSGEFSRFRRSRILSASEEKSLIDENNNFDGNIDEDEMANKKVTIAKDPDLSAKDLFQPTLKNDDENIQPIRVSKSNVAEGVRKDNKPSDKDNSPSNISQNSNQKTFDPSSIMSLESEVAEDSIKPENVLNSSNDIKKGTGNASTDSMPLIPKPKGVSGDLGGKTNIAQSSLKTNKPLLSLTNGSKGNIITKIPAKDIGSPKSRSDIVMFSLKPVEKAVPSINETSSIIDFAKVAKEISLTNDTKSNRRYEVPREESGSGSGWRYQSGSGSAIEDIAVTKSTISRNRAYKHQKHSDISLNEAAFLSHLNPSSGSGSGSEEAENDNESGSGGHLIETKEVKQTNGDKIEEEKGPKRTVQNPVKIPHKDDDLNKTQEQIKNSTNIEQGFLNQSHNKANDSNKMQEHKGSTKTEHSFVNLQNKDIDPVKIQEQKGPTRIEQSFVKLSHKINDPDKTQERQGSTKTDHYYVKLSRNTTEISLESPNDYKGTKNSDQKGIRRTYSNVAKEIANATLPIQNISAISSNQSAANSSTANKYPPGHTAVAQPVPVPVSNNTLQKKEEVDTSNNWSRINEKNTSAILQIENGTKTQNITLKDDSKLQNISVKPIEKKRNLTKLHELSPVSTAMLEGMHFPTNDTPKNNISGSTNNSELLESTDEIMSYVNNLTNAEANFTNITSSKVNVSEGEKNADINANNLQGNFSNNKNRDIVEETRNLTAGVSLLKNAEVPKVNFISEDRMHRPEEKMLNIAGEDELSQETSKLFDFENNEGSWGDLTNSFSKQKANKMELPAANEVDEDLPGSRGGGLNEEDLQALQQKSPEKVKAAEVDDDIMSTADVKFRDIIAMPDSGKEFKTNNGIKDVYTLNKTIPVKKTIETNSSPIKKDGVEMQIESTIKSSFDESIKNIVGNQSISNDLLPGDYGDETPLLIENESGSGSAVQDSSNELYSASGSGESDSEVNLLLKAVANNRHFDKSTAKSQIYATKANVNTSSPTSQETFNNSASIRSDGSTEDYLTSGEYLSESGSGSGSSDIDFELSPEYEGNTNNALKVSSVGSAMLTPKSENGMQPTIARIPISFYANATTAKPHIDTTAVSFGEGPASSTSEDETKVESASGSASGSESVMEKLNEIVNDNEKVSAIPSLDEDGSEDKAQLDTSSISPSSKPTFKIKKITTTEAATLPTARGTIHKKHPRTTHKHHKEHKHKFVVKEKIAGKNICFKLYTSKYTPNITQNT